MVFSPKLPLHRQQLLLMLLLLVVVIAGANGVAVALEASRFLTAKDTPYRLTEMAPLRFQNIDFTADATIKINTRLTYQSMVGFGGAFTEASAFVYSSLNAENRKFVLNAYWGPTGLNYTVGRIHMNSCDFSLDNYSEDDVSNDFDLQHFNISHDFKWLVPLVKDALQTYNNYKFSNKSPLRLFVSPWSPPAWMKTNGKMDGSNRPCLLPDPRVHNAWAQHFSKFISAYEKEGIRIWAVTVQNEPEFAAPWEACVYTPEEQRDFIKIFLGPAIKQNHPDVGIMIYDHNRDHIVEWVKTIMQDPIASSYVAGTAFHWYSEEGYENLDTAHNLAPSKFLLATEGCNCPNVLIGDWGRAETYAYDMINDINHWSVGWTDWNILLNANGGPNHLQNWCDAHIIADPSQQKITVQNSYYYFGHISKWISPASVRVDASVSVSGGANNNVFATAVKTPDNNIVVVVMNRGDASIPTLKIQDSQTGLYLRTSAPAHSIQTFLYSNSAM